MKITTGGVIPATLTSRNVSRGCEFPFRTFTELLNAVNHALDIGGKQLTDGNIVAIKTAEKTDHSECQGLAIELLVECKNKQFQIVNPETQEMDEWTHKEIKTALEKQMPASSYQTAAGHSRSAVLWVIWCLYGNDILCKLNFEFTECTEKEALSINLLENAQLEVAQRTTPEQKLKAMLVMFQRDPEAIELSQTEACKRVGFDVKLGGVRQRTYPVARWAFDKGITVEDQNALLDDALKEGIHKKMKNTDGPNFAKCETVAALLEVVEKKTVKPVTLNDVNKIIGKGQKKVHPYIRALIIAQNNGDSNMARMLLLDCGDTNVLTETVTQFLEANEQFHPGDIERMANAPLDTKPAPLGEVE